MRRQQLPGSQDAFLPRGQRLVKVLLGKKNTAIDSSGPMPRKCCPALVRDWG